MASSEERLTARGPSSDADWKLFELRYKNLQSISKAQKVHLTTILIQMTLLWIWYASGSKDVAVQGVSLTPEGVWLATPAVLTFFCLAFIGSVNAALPAKTKLIEAGEKLSVHPDFGCKFAFYDLDTDKNVLDYLTFLKISPTNNHFDQSGRFNIRHFFYPAVMLASMATTCLALQGFPNNCRFATYTIVCLGLQVLFSIRPFYRAIRRFAGHDVDNVAS